MIFFRKRNFKKATYFYTKYSDVIGLHQKDYLVIKHLFPLHSVEFQGNYAVIQLSCPLKSFYTHKKFYHFDKRLDFSYLIENNAFAFGTFKDENIKGINSDVSEEGDTPLPADFSPCSLCKNELSCMFSSIKLEFQPKEYNTLYFLDILKENGFTESKDMYYRFLACFDEHYHYSEFEPETLQDYIIVFGLVLPLVLCLLPFYFLGSGINKIKHKFKKSIDETNL